MAQQFKTNLLISGGGASGLAAAVAAKRIFPDLKVCILEKNARIGKKILVTGNGRCNLGNYHAELDAYHGSFTKILPNISKNTLDAETFFQSMGLICRREADGRLYPHSNQATSVLDALRLTVDQLQVEILCDCAVKSIQKEKEEFVVETSHGTVISDCVIVTTGGYAAPKTGSDGSVFQILHSFGHCTTEIKPALVAFYTEPNLVRSLKGVRVSAAVSAWSSRGKRLCEEIGEVQFTEHSISGICVMNLSAKCVENDPAYLSLNLLSTYTAEQVTALLWDIYAVRTEWKIEDWLTGLFSKKIGLQLLHTAHIAASFQAPVYTITPTEIERIAVLCQDWRFPVISRGGWQEAQVTAGGIPLEEVDETLQSKLVAGLFFAGEILDLHGNCGGYNLNWAWQSGQFAAKSAIQYLQDQKEEQAT